MISRVVREVLNTLHSRQLLLDSSYNEKDIKAVSKRKSDFNTLQNHLNALDSIIRSIVPNLTTNHISEYENPEDFFKDVFKPVNTVDTVDTESLDIINKLLKYNIDKVQDVDLSNIRKYIKEFGVNNIVSLLSNKEGNAFSSNILKALSYTYTKTEYDDPSDIIYKMIKGETVYLEDEDGIQIEFNKVSNKDLLTTKFSTPNSFPTYVLVYTSKDLKNFITFNKDTFKLSILQSDETPLNLKHIITSGKFSYGTLFEQLREAVITSQMSDSVSSTNKINSVKKEYNRIVRYLIDTMLSITPSNIKSMLYNNLNTSKDIESFIINYAQIDAFLRLYTDVISNKFNNAQQAILSKIIRDSKGEHSAFMVSDEMQNFIGKLQKDFELLTDTLRIRPKGSGKIRSANLRVIFDLANALSTKLYKDICNNLPSLFTQIASEYARYSTETGMLPIGTAFEKYTVESKDMQHSVSDFLDVNESLNKRLQNFLNATITYKFTAPTNEVISNLEKIEKNVEDKELLSLIKEFKGFKDLYKNVTINNKKLYDDLLSSLGLTVSNEELLNKVKEIQKNTIQDNFNTVIYSEEDIASFTEAKLSTKDVEVLKFLDDYITFKSMVINDIISKSSKTINTTMNKLSNFEVNTPIITTLVSLNDINNIYKKHMKSFMMGNLSGVYSHYLDNLLQKMSTTPSFHISNMNLTKEDTEEGSISNNTIKANISNTFNMADYNDLSSILEYLEKNISLDFIAKAYLEVFGTEITVGRLKEVLSDIKDIITNDIVKEVLDTQNNRIVAQEAKRKSGIVSRVLSYINDKLKGTDVLSKEDLDFYLMTIRKDYADGEISLSKKEKEEFNTLSNLVSTKGYNSLNKEQKEKFNMLLQIKLKDESSTFELNKTDLDRLSSIKNKLKKVGIELTETSISNIESKNYNESREIPIFEDTVVNAGMLAKYLYNRFIKEATVFSDFEKFIEIQYKNKAGIKRNNRAIYKEFIDSVTKVMKTYNSNWFKTGSLPIINGNIDIRAVKAAFKAIVDFESKTGATLVLNKDRFVNDINSFIDKYSTNVLGYNPNYRDTILRDLAEGRNSKLINYIKNNLKIEDFKKSASEERISSSMYANMSSITNLLGKVKSWFSNRLVQEDLEYVSTVIGDISTKMLGHSGWVDLHLDNKYNLNVIRNSVGIKALRNALRIAYKIDTTNITDDNIIKYLDTIKGMLTPVPFDDNFAATILVSTSLASNKYDAVCTGAHELFHFADKAALIPFKAKQVLIDFFKKRGNPNLAWYEKAAEDFGIYVQDKEMAKHLGHTSKIKYIFYKINKFFRELGNFFLKRGYTPITDIYDNLLSGVYAENMERKIGSKEGMFIFLRDNTKGNIDSNLFLSLEPDNKFKEVETLIENRRPNIESYSTSIKKTWQNNTLMGFLKSITNSTLSNINKATSQLFRGAFPELHNKEMAFEHEILLKALHIPTVSVDKTIRFLREITNGLSKYEVSLMNRVLLTRDILNNFKQGLQTEQEIIEQFENTYTSIDDVIEHNKYLESKLNSNIKQAIDRRAKIISDLYKVLKESPRNYYAGERELKPLEYFHRMAIYNFKLKTKGIIPYQFKLMFKSMLPMRQHNVIPYQTDYLLSEYDALVQMISTVEQEKLIVSLENLYSKDIEHLKTLATQVGFKKWEHLFNPVFEGKYFTGEFAKYKDYSLYSLNNIEQKYDVIRLSNTKVEELAKASKEDIKNTISVSKNDTRKAVATKTFEHTILVKTPVANAMQTLFDTENEYNIFSKTLRKLNGYLKRYMILNPFGAMKYMVNNITGDFDKISASGHLTGIMAEAGAAFTDIKKYVTYISGKTKTLDLSESVKKEIENAIEDGVISSGLTATEIPEIVTNSAFREFLGDYDSSVFSKYWNYIGDINNIRESTLRFAAYRFFKKNIGNYNSWKDIVANTPINSALASNVKILEGLNDGNLIASKLARDLLGDYTNISPAGQYIREHLIPFWSWIEINMGSYFALMKNAVKEGYAPKKSIFGAAFSLGKRIALFNSFYAAVALYNMIFFPDDWEDSIDASKGQLHLILNKKSDGTLQTLKVQGAWYDFLSYLGMESMPYYTIASLSNKDNEGVLQARFKEALKTTPLAAFNKITQAALPVPKAMLEIVTKTNLFPNITDPHPLRDRLDPVYKLMGIKNILDEIGDKPQRPSSKGIANTSTNIVTSLLLNKLSPEESKYFRTIELAKNFMKANKLSYSITNAPTSPRAESAYFFKQALMFGDEEAALKYATSYFRYKGEIADLKKSINNANPISQIPIKYRNTFFKNLINHDKFIVKSALTWYNKVFLAHSNIPSSSYYKILIEAKRRAKAEGIIDINKSSYD